MKKKMTKTLNDLTDVEIDSLWDDIKSIIDMVLKTIEKKLKYKRLSTELSYRMITGVIQGLCYGLAENSTNAESREVIRQRIINLINSEFDQLREQSEDKVIVH